MVIGSKTDCLYMDKNRIKIAIAFSYQSNDMELRMRDVIGKVSMYQYYIKKLHFERRVSFEVMMRDEIHEVKEMVEEISNG